MADLPPDLRNALDAVLNNASTPDLNSSFRRLSTRYREEVAATEPILRSAADVATYSAYRMPATFAAVRGALEQAAALRPDFRPTSQLDIGGGTGAAIWAATGVWPSLTSVTVLEQVPEAIAMGKKLAAGAESPVLRNAVWRNGRLDDLDSSADVITVSYVLSELSAAQQNQLVQHLSKQQGFVVLVEPGTPTGYERIVEARDQLIAAGHTIVAPCPHDLDCPIPRGRDWCHFAGRINRSSLHRQTKGAVLSFEDEKFSYVISTPATTAQAQADNRILRHPQQRKGLVSLTLCTTTGTLEDRIVSKRQGLLYRAARNTEWGDPWPPPDPNHRTA